VRRSLLALGFSLLVLTAGLPAGAQNRVPPSGTAPVARPQSTVRRGDAESERLERLAAEVVRTTREYRASLERILGIYQRDADARQFSLRQRRVTLKKINFVAERLPAHFGDAEFEGDLVLELCRPEELATAGDAWPADFDGFVGHHHA